MRQLMKHQMKQKILKFILLGSAMNAPLAFSQSKIPTKQIENLINGSDKLSFMLGLESLEADLARQVEDFSKDFKSFYDAVDANSNAWQKAMVQKRRGVLTWLEAQAFYKTRDLAQIETELLKLSKNKLVLVGPASEESTKSYFIALMLSKSVSTKQKGQVPVLALYLHGRALYHFALGQGLPSLELYVSRETNKKSERFRNARSMIKLIEATDGIGEE